MKKLILLLAFCAATFSLSAHIKTSELNIKLFDNSVFYLTLDNHVYNNFTNAYHIKQISNGNHFLKVMRFRKGPNPHNNNPKTIFAGYIYVPGGMKIMGMIDMFNNYTVTNQFPIYNHHDDDWDGGWNDDSPMPPTPPVYYLGMEPSTFMELKNMLNNTSFDDSKLTIAKQALINNNISAEQVLNLMGAMTFESTKLDFAKFAYNYTVDKEKYFMVNNGFTFSSSIDELNRFIQGH